MSRNLLRGTRNVGRNERFDGGHGRPAGRMLDETPGPTDDHSVDPDPPASGVPRGRIILILPSATPARDPP